MLSDVILGIPTLLDRTNLHVVGEKAVEKVNVGVTKNREVLVLLNVGLLQLEDAEAFGGIVSSAVNSLQACQESEPTSLHLVLVAVNAGRSETVSPQVLSGLVLVGSAVVTPAQKVSIVARKKKLSHCNCLRRRVDMAGRGAVVGVL